VKQHRASGEDLDGEPVREFLEPVTDTGVQA
jgi:hypothetical protein